MIREPAELSKGIRDGRRALEDISECEILQDFTWDPERSVWALHLRLSPGHAPTDHVPAITDWFVLVDPLYPAGEVSLYPAKEHGLTATFPHQNPNTAGPPEVAWRDGKICTDTGVRALGRHGYDHEPRTSRGRIEWHVLRGLDWLVAASGGELVRAGEPYELPAFPPSGATVIAFQEDTSSFDDWRAITASSGIATFVQHPDNPTILAVRRLDTWKGSEAAELRWGKTLSEAATEETGVWLRIAAIPVAPPYQPARTWGEFRTILRNQEVDLFSFVDRIPVEMRTGKDVVLLLGFEIPRRHGDSPEQLHWQAIQLPVLASEKRTVAGFRPGKDGRQQWDRRHALATSKEVVYFRTENWAEDEISSRGRFDEQLRKQRVLLIGAGALGSVVAEMLVRGGVHRIRIMDSDAVRAGNLVRHTLDLRDVGENKAVALAARLNTVSPHAQVEHEARDLGWTSATDLENEKPILVLECTGDDDVARKLADHSFPESTRIFSLSLGLYARRLFTFAAPHPPFPFHRFQAMLQPWLKDEQERYAGEEISMEGIGCWHPVFPARVDDIWKLGAVAVRAVEELIETPPADPVLRVIEQSEETGEVRMLGDAPE